MSVMTMRGYSRDELRGSLQIVYGLLCDRDGRPVAIEAYQGNTVDSKTVQSQIGILPLSLSEQQNLAEITADDYPGERLVICRLRHYRTLKPQEPNQGTPFL